MKSMMNLLTNPNTGERTLTYVSDVNNPKWTTMLKKCMEALGKAKPDFGEDLDGYEFSRNDNFFKLTITLKNGIDLEIEYPGYELFPAEMIDDFGVNSLIIPNDITEKQEFETEKVIIRKIWNFYRT